jgi:hypothetical protein
VEEFPFGLRPWLIGGGRLEGETRQFRLVLPPSPRGYADAQVDDYQGLPRRQFPRRPPLRLALEARASHSAPLGTLGFGFWNDPFAASLGLGGGSRRLPATPRALWFFYGSPPNRLAFRPGDAGQGWLAAALDSPSVPAALLLPSAAVAVAVSRVRPGAGLVVSALRRLIRASEATLPVPLAEWHHYQLDWDRSEAIFRVDGAPAVRVEAPPAGPLGFVAWIDNQYAAISPRRGIRFGVLPTTEPQWLEIRGLSIEG